MNKIGIIKANYGHKGDLAIVKGTLNVFKQLGVNVKYFIDPDIGMPENLFGDIPIIRSWPSILQQNVVSGKGIRKKAYLEALASFLTWKPKDVDLDLLWYMGGVRFGSMTQKYAVMELVNALYSKHRFKSKIIFGGVSIQRGKNTLSKIYTNSLYKKAIMDINYIFTRDKLTFNFLKTLGYPTTKISFVCDFSFHLDSKRTVNTDNISQIIREYEKPVGIIADTSMLKNVKYGFDNKRFQRLLKLVQKFKNKGFSVMLIPLSHLRLSNPPPFTQDDCEACNEVNNMLGMNLPIIQTKSLEPEEIIQIMKDLDGIVSVGRLHGAAFGCLANIPTAHVYFEDKALMYNDYFGRFPLFWHCDWVTQPKINDEIIGLIESQPAVDYKDKIAIWRKKSLDEVKSVLIKQGVLP